MKKFLCLAGTLLTVACLTLDADAQILNRIKERVSQSAENRVINKAENATERSMDKIEQGAKGKKSSRSATEESSESGGTEKTASPSTQTTQKQQEASLTAYSNYDFVPGDRLIYFYDMAGEADSEIPGRMLIDEGTVEVQTYKGEVLLCSQVAGSKCSKHGSHYLRRQRQHLPSLIIINRISFPCLPIKAFG